MRHRIRYAFGVAIVVGMTLLARGAQAQISVVSFAQDGGPANGRSSGASLSADGRFVAFTSDATNLVTGDANGSSDVFVRDRQAGTTTRVSVTTAGVEAAGASTLGQMTPDGRFVVFTSAAVLVAADTNACPNPTPTVPTCSDIYIHDRHAPATTTRISVATGGTQANGHSYGASISADARYVVFTSEATNLVPNDTNGQPDVFLHDRQTGTTTRVSVNADGSQMARGGSGGLISENAEIIVYDGFAAQQDVNDPTTCDPALASCRAIYLRIRETGATTLLSNLLPPHHQVDEPNFRTTFLSVIDVTADGRFVVMAQRGSFVGGSGKYAYLRWPILDRLTGRITGTLLRQYGYMLPADVFFDVSSDGRTIASNAPPTHDPYPGEPWALLQWYDRIADVRERVNVPVPGVYVEERTVPYGVKMSADGRFTAFTTELEVLASDTNTFDDVFLYDRDADGDGLPTVWETTFGLDPANADAAADPDGDGLTNQQEFQRGSHPVGTFTRYFAEGASNDFFQTGFSAFNPGTTTAAHVVFRYFGPAGESVSDQFTLPVLSRKEVVPTIAGLFPIENDFSTIIESDQPIVIDRSMSWGTGDGAGSHAETSIAAPSTTWYLAEGATHGAFDLFYLLLNPSPTDVTVTIRYLRLNPSTPIVKNYNVPANSRRTIWVDDEGPDLAAADVAASISSTLPIIVERAMYSSRPGQAPFTAGHGGAGVTAPALKWFLAEGATGSFFDLYVLVANPGTAASAVKVTYLLGNGGQSFSKTYNVAAQTRMTLSIKDEDPRLADTPVSMVVESTNNEPIVVERAMWWPRDQWYEAHLSAGATTTGTRWALAAGQVTNDLKTRFVETYILIANTSSTAGSATVTLLDGSGQLIVHTVPLPANSRVNVPASSLYQPPVDRFFSAIVESDGVQIVVERAIYGGADWSTGSAALGTKLQ